MTEKRNIKIRNIYHMLAYAFRDVLSENRYRELGSEEFDHQSDLLAAILIIGTGNQIKRGIDKNYMLITEEKNCPIGKINISASIKGNTLIMSRLVCDFDEFTVDIEINRILKTTLNILVDDKSVSSKNRKKLRGILPFFSSIDILDPYDIQWSRIHYHKNNAAYRMLLFICELVISGSLMNEDGKGKKNSDYFDDKKLELLFQNFVRKYYEVEFPEYSVSSPSILWDTDDCHIEYLPNMNTDVVLESKNMTLIIDTKFYTKEIIKTYHKKKMISSPNLYQMYAYVNNKIKERIRNGHFSGAVCGLILYAKTETEDDLNLEYSISGNKYIIKTLNMNDDWNNIEARLKEFTVFLHPELSGSNSSL